MRLAILSQAIQLLSLFQIAVIWLLALSNPARAAVQPFDVVVTADSTRVMAGEKPIGEVQKDTRLTVSQTNGDWYLIDVPNANPPQQGWIRKSDVQPPPASDDSLTPQQREQLKERDKFEHQANELRDAGKLDEAIAAAEKMLAIEQAVLGRDSLDATSSLVILAGMYETKEDFATARKLREEVLAATAKQQGTNYWRTTDARLALEQTALLEKLDPSQRAQLGEADRLTAEVSKFYSAGEFVKALKPAERALEIQRGILDEHHRDYGNSLRWLAEVHRRLGDYAKAEPLFIQAILVLKKTLGEKHPDYAGSLCNLATLYQDMGDNAKAEPLRKQALEIDRQVLGERDLAYAIDLSGLGTLYKDLGDYAKAEPLYRQALAIKKERVGEMHPSYLLSLNNLARLYEKMGDYAKAEPLCNRAMEISKQVLGEKHPDHIASLFSLANLYVRLGDYGRAAAIHFSLIASCLRNNVEPFAYLRDLLTRLPSLLAGASRETLHALLPDRWQPAQ